jgi:hypothetical protein
MLLNRFFAKVLLGEIEMSKKNSLNEVRRFMKLANLGANLSSNFVTKLEETDHTSVNMNEEDIEEGMHDAAYQRDDEEEAEEGEDEELELDGAELDAGEDMELDAEEDMDMDMDMDMDAEEPEAVLTDDEADAIIALADKLRSARDEEGGELEPVDDMGDDMEADADEDIMEEESLEEILKDVLGEDDTIADDPVQKAFFDGEDAADANLAALQAKAAGEAPHDSDDTQGDKAKKRMAARKRSIPKLTEDEMVHEVLRRVKTRLNAMSKSKE